MEVILCEEFDHVNAVGCASASRKGQVLCIFITILHCPTSPRTERLLLLSAVEIDKKGRANAWMQIFKLQRRQIWYITFHKYERKIHVK